MDFLDASTTVEFVLLPTSYPATHLVRIFSLFGRSTNKQIVQFTVIMHSVNLFKAEIWVEV